MAEPTLLIAERINATRRRMAQAFAERDADLLRREARLQAEAGADYLDVNAGLSPEAEPDLMAWAVETVRDAVALPLAVDSANPAAVRAGLERLPKGSAFLNSLSGRHRSLEAMLPLAAEFQPRVVALAMDDAGIPATADARWRAIDAILSAVDRAGIPRDRLYVDPLVRPVSTDPDQAAVCLGVLREVPDRGGGARTILGLSNVSYGLPARRHLNRTFLAMAAAAGLSAAILDPLDPEMLATVRAAACLLGRDAFCMNYIAAHRAGRL